MDRAARLLRGTLRVRVESAFPERVLNLCGAHGIAFSDLRWESASALSFAGDGRRPSATPLFLSIAPKMSPLQNRLIQEGRGRSHAGACAPAWAQKRLE